MCMNCGCGEAGKRHKPTDITRDDLQQAADGGDQGHGAMAGRDAGSTR